MTLLFLVRHGTTDAVGRRLVGRMSGIPLNDAGRAQAAALGARFAHVPLAGVYTSPLERAVSTATAIAEPHGLAPMWWPALTDVDFGDWTGKALAELRESAVFGDFNTRRSLTRPPAGEHALEVQLRVVSALQEIAAAHPEDAVAVVSHADPIRASIAYILGMPLDALVRFEIDAGSVSQLELATHGARVLSLNQPSDLKTTM
ncbi:MAG TPA: histidine phosphatase family protein [Polyangiaceae bacterium]